MYMNRSRASSAIAAHGRRSSSRTSCCSTSRIRSRSREDADPAACDGSRDGYVRSLFVFCRQRSAVNGQILHHHIVKCGIDSPPESPFIPNLLLRMYGQCGYLDHSSLLFALLPSPDRFSWSFLIQCHAQHGKSQEAFRLYHQMQCSGTIPDSFVHVSLLSSCFRLADGKRIHARLICSSPPAVDSVLGTSILNMYGKCGDLNGAERVFGLISERDLVAWNSMIMIYAQCGSSAKALDAFGQMIQEEVDPDEYTLVNLISATNTDASRREGRLIHNQAVVYGQADTMVDVGNAIVNMYVKHGFIEEAKKTLDDMHVRNVVTWTSIATGCLLHGHTAEALSSLDRMLWEGFIPDDVTLVSIFSSLDELNLGKRIHASNIGAERRCARVCNALLAMYVNCRSLHDAKALFDGIANKKEVVAWSTMMEGFAQHGKIDDALELLDHMRVEGVEPDMVVFVSILSSCMDRSALPAGQRMHACIHSCGGFGSDVTIGNALINMYRRCGHAIGDVLTMFRSMEKWNTVSYIGAISACGDRTCLQEGKWLHFCILDTESALDGVVTNALLTMYGKCGCLTDARAVFSKATCNNRGLALWNAMIGAYAQNGQGKEALRLFKRMKAENMRADEATFVSVLSACSHAGLLDEGFEQLVSMYRDYGICAEVDHYNCMIDLLGRVGRLEEAENMIDAMPCESTRVSWMTLLSACRDQGDVERSERAAEQASALEMDH